MGYDISAYVERRDGDKWVLTSDRPVSSRLKYIIEDYRDYQKIDWESLSDGLKDKFRKDENGNVFASFNVASISEIESSISAKIKETYVRINTIVKALGCQRVYSDDGEEIEPWGDENEKNDRLTFPVNKWLIEDFQYCLSDARKIGQKEAFDLFASELMSDYGAEYRIVFVVT